MPKNILVRDIPDDVSNWIMEERQQYQVSQQEFLFDLLTSARDIKSGMRNKLDTPRLFSSQPKQLPFKFIDLFAGIGVSALLLNILVVNVFSLEEWDKFSQKTYTSWFGETPSGDITKIKPKDIPDHDILAAGFPCQPFSIAGVSFEKRTVLDRNMGSRIKLKAHYFSI